MSKSKKTKRANTNAVKDHIHTIDETDWKKFCDKLDHNLRSNKITNYTRNQNINTDIHPHDVVMIKKVRPFRPNKKSWRYFTVQSYDDVTKEVRLVSSNPDDVQTMHKFEKQRTEQGFDDREVWGLDTTIVAFIYPRLQAFVKQAESDGFGTPMSYTQLKDENGKTISDKAAFALYLKDLKRMEEGFGYYYQETVGCWTGTEDERKEREAAIKDAATLLGKLVYDLWY